MDNIINKLKKVKENMMIYYNIYNNMINNYEIKNRNYNILKNINEINNNIIKDIKEINNNINNKIYKILKIYNKMKPIIDINIIYRIDKEDEKLRLFGDEFVKNNQKKCKLLIDNKEYNLMREYNIKNYNKKQLEIKLIIFNNITNMGYLFFQCRRLLLLPDISK